MDIISKKMTGYLSITWSIPSLPKPLSILEFEISLFIKTVAWIHSKKGNFTPHAFYQKWKKKTKLRNEHDYFQPLDTWRTFWFLLRQTLSTYCMGLIQSALVKAMSEAVQKIFSSNLDVFWLFYKTLKWKSSPKSHTEW